MATRLVGRVASSVFLIAAKPIQVSGMVICPPMSGGNSLLSVPYSRNACAIMRWRRSSRLNCDADATLERNALMARYVSRAFSLVAV